MSRSSKLATLAAVLATTCAAGPAAAQGLPPDGAQGCLWTTSCAAGPGTVDGPTMDGSTMTFTVRGALKIKRQSGETQTVPFDGYKAEKSVGEAIAESPNDIPCEEGAGDGAAPEVAFDVPRGVPSFSLKDGSAYCSVIGKAKRLGLTFKIKTEVGASGVTG